MDRVHEVEEIRRMAADLFDSDRLGLAGEMSPEQYAEELVSCFQADEGLDEHDARLLRRFIAEKARRLRDEE